MKNIFKQVIAMGLILFIPNLSVFSQVAINADASLPDNSAMLDVKSTDKGMLFPRMTLAQRNAIFSPAAGLTVFQTDNTPGFYFNSGTSGSPIWSIVGSGSGWGLTGNSGTNSGTNFIGTTDGQPLMLKVNNQKAGYIDYASPFNTSFGYQSLNSNSGTNNTAFGYQALSSNTTGSGNTVSGFKSLYYNTSGTDNTASGFGALFSNTQGSANTVIGSYALLYNVAGSNATAVGVNAMYYANNASVPFTNYNVAIGYEALRGSTSASSNTGNFNTALGYQTIWTNTSGNENTACGYQALVNNTTGSWNTASGYQALGNNTVGSQNIADGYKALFNNTIGYQNTADGMYALYANTSGTYNTANGFAALYSNTTGAYNTADGIDALYWNISGGGNTACGYQALYDNSIGLGNTANGTAALYSNTSGSDNTAVGLNALSGNITGSNNTAIGCNAGTYYIYTNAATAIGYNAVTLNDNRITIGTSANYNLTGGFGAWQNFSDGRFKENVQDNVPGLAFINKLHPVTYNLNAEKVDEFYGIKQRMDTCRNAEEKARYLGRLIEVSSQVQTGFIAQEVEATAKSIGYDFDGVHHPATVKDNYTIGYSTFVAPLVKAVQELDQKNETLEDFVKAQQQSMELLKNQNEQLLQRIVKLENK